MYSVTTLRTRQQRLQIMGDNAPVVSGSPRPNPRILRSERLQWLSKPGPAGCRQHWIAGSPLSLQQQAAASPGRPKMTLGAQTAARDAHRIASTTQPTHSRLVRCGASARFPSIFFRKADDMT
jgi:hypothetical protein